MVVMAVSEGLSATVGLVVTAGLELRQAHQSQSVVGPVVTVGPPGTVETEVPEVPHRQTGLSPQPMVAMVVTVVRSVVRSVVRVVLRLQWAGLPHPASEAATTKRRTTKAAVPAAGTAQ
jgi:hypothetical protein